jgi:hypothetical protein
MSDEKPFIDVNFQEFSDSVLKGNEHVLDQTAMTFLDAVRESIENWTEILSSESRLYRAQRGCEWPQDPEDPNPMAMCHPERRMKPDPAKVGPGRANVSRKPAFYAATSEITAIKETRPWISALISVGYFETTRPLRLVNLVDAYLGQRESFIFLTDKFHQKPTRERAEQAAWHFIGEAYSTPVTLDDDPKGYLPTQILAELFKSEGLDGIAYRSSVEASKEEDEPVEYNIVLFNSDDVKQVGGHVSEVTGFDITIDHGPHY